MVSLPSPLSLATAQLFLLLLISASLTLATSIDFYNYGAAPESVIQLVLPTRTTTLAVSQTSQLPKSFVTQWNKHGGRAEQTSSEAIIVLNSVIQDGFPNTICALTIDLWDDLPVQPIGSTPGELRLLLSLISKRLTKVDQRTPERRYGVQARIRACPLASIYAADETTPATALRLLRVLQRILITMAGIALSLRALLYGVFKSSHAALHLCRD